MKEIIELRSPHEKHFKKTDGTNIAYLYDEAVNYLKDGKYVPIDNTIIEQENYYINKDNSFKVLFPKCLDNRHLYELTSEKYFMKISLLEDKRDDMTIETDKNTLTYKNILEGIDIEYKVIGSRLKESIVLNKKTDSPLSFKIQTDVELKKEGEKISCYKNGVNVCNLNAPFMTSLNQNRGKVSYKLEGDILTLELEEDFLNREDYPIIIDPTISERNTGVYDTFIYPGDSGTYKGTYDYLKIGTSSNGIKHRALVKFDLPNLLSGSQVIKAVANFASYKTDIIDTISAPVEIHEITAPWDENSANWDSMNDKFDSRIEYLCALNRSYSNGNTIQLSSNSLDITRLVKKWYADSPNNGFMIKMFDETYNPSSREYLLYSKDHTETSVNPKPFLAIAYRNCTGIVPHMEYESIPFTDGSANVNLYTGNVTTIFNVGSTIAGKFPVTLTLVHNRADYNQKDTLYGWRFNFAQKIKPMIISDTEYLEYIDGTGCRVYFCKQSDRTYNDEDGRNLTVKYENDTYTMIDKYGSKNIFTKQNNEYLLTKVIDIAKNEINVFYNSDNRLTKIVDANNQEITIVYDGLGKRNSDIYINSPYTKTEIMLCFDHILSIKTKKSSYLIGWYSTDNDEIYDGALEMILEQDIGTLYYEYHDNNIRKIKKLSIKNNSETGLSLDFTYDFNMTKVKNEKNIVYTYSFSDQGNTIGKTILDSNGKLTDSYGFNSEYIEDIDSKNNNKMSESTAKIKYIKDDYQNIEIYPVGGEETYEGGRTGKKIYKGDWISFQSNCSENYVFSGYVKCNTKFEVNVLEPGPNSPKYISYEICESNGEFVRFEAEVPAGNGMQILITTTDDTMYLDDIQLEKGNVANPYNMIVNGDFKDPNKMLWSILSHTSVQKYYDIVDINNDEKALRITGKYDNKTTAAYIVDYIGKKDDTYTLAFWYKNEGIFKGKEEERGNSVKIQIKNTDGTDTIYNFALNRHISEWQMFSKCFIAEKDYSEIEITIQSVNEANYLYLTNFMLIKDLGKYSYTYDEEGNLISASDFAKNDSKFNFDKNNQLISSFTPRGNHYSYEYDNDVTDRVLKGISPTGISNEIEYDSFGNPIKTVINNVNPDVEIVDKKHYKVRKKGTKEYLDVDTFNKIIEIKTRECNHKSFQFHKEGDYYRIEYFGYYLGISEIGLILSKSQEDTTLFKFEKLENNSCLILPKSDEDKALTVQNGRIIIENKDKNNINQQFYIEDTESNQFIESKATYTEDGRFMTEITDSLNHTTLYNFDKTNGLIKSITDNNENITNYSYDSKNRLTSVNNNEKTISYIYNNKNQLSTINSGTKKYTLDYNQFNNLTSVKINDSTLIENSYDNKNNLLSSTYGNDFKISYTYDNLNRLNSTIYPHKTYSYGYDNLGNIIKIESENEIHRYFYDFANRLIKTITSDLTNKLVLSYDYNEDNNIIRKKSSLQTHSSFNEVYKMPDVLYDYNKDDSIVKITFGNHSQNNTYDYLGRLSNKNIDGTLQFGYSYLSKGDKTSIIVKSLKVADDLYEYKYDNVYNIIDIYLNGEIINHYTYDNLYQLTKDDNYTLNKSFVYTYNTEGNILSKREYSLNSTNLLKTDTFEYNNINWEDQLTKYNNETITYDKIGNPLTIGTKTLTWINGRQLKTYTDSSKNLSISYEYNKDGIRTSKTVNNKKTEYYMEGTNVILEKTGENVLYYIRDDANNLIGFKYNDTQYYYVKNLQEDIIGIVDSNFDKVATYVYDAWGRIVSIKDSSGNEITNTNHIAIINPYRYRSYYYDTETSLYYLKTRYYSPEWGRFLNADSYTSTGQDILANNMYLYCSNNPIFKIDNLGNLWKEIVSAWNGIKTAIVGLKPAYAGATGIAAVDGPLPYGDIIGAAAAVALTIGTVGYGISKSITKKEIYTPKTYHLEDSDYACELTYIYRYGGTNPGNLTPKKKDLNNPIKRGLSFSTIPPINGDAAVTTIEAVNATGILKAVQDDYYHVSITPVGADLSVWVNAGPTSVWTQTLKGIVVKWDGVSK